MVKHHDFQSLARFKLQIHWILHFLWRNPMSSFSWRFKKNPKTSISIVFLILKASHQRKKHYATVFSGRTILLMTSKLILVWSRWSAPVKPASDCRSFKILTCFLIGLHEEKHAHITRFASNVTSHSAGHSYDYQTTGSDAPCHVIFPMRPHGEADVDKMEQQLVVKPVKEKRAQDWTSVGEEMLRRRCQHRLSLLQPQLEVRF